MTKKLHYGGSVFEVSDSAKPSDLSDESGRVTIWTKKGARLTLVTGPGISIALEEPQSGTASAPPRTATVL